MGDEFLRPESGFRFAFAGLKTNARPDALPPGKYPLATNIRAYSTGTIQSRPGAVRSFTASPTGILYPISDMRTYAALATGNAPRTLAYDLNGRVWLDNGMNVGTLSGGVGSSGASMIPFRPNASPEPWMYIANGGDYQKFSAPDLTNIVTMQKVGIAEPQVAPDAAIAENFINLIAVPGYVNAGTAGGTGAANRVADTAGTVLQDPTGASIWTVQVGTGIAYQKLQQLLIDTTQFMVMDVFVALPTALTIQSIYYFTGTTGHCIIVPASLATESEDTIFKDAILSTIRRGTMIVVGAEKCYVWSVSAGPNGGISIETSTTGAHTSAETLTTVPAISVIAGMGSSQSATSGAGGHTATSGPATATEAIWTGAPTLSIAVDTLDANYATSTIPASTVPGDHGTALLSITGFGFAIPPTATVLGIQASVYWAGGVGVVDSVASLIKGGVVELLSDHSEGTNIFAGAYPRVYGTATDLWNASLYGGLAPGDINAANFGIALGAFNNDTANPRLAEIDYVQFQVFYNDPAVGVAPPVAGQAITDPDTTYAVAAGIGTITSALVPVNPFNRLGASFQVEDYISLGIFVDVLANLTEMKFLLDVDDGSFTKNFYYFTVRPSDITAAIANTVTGIASAQTTAQRASIDAETSAINAQAGFFDVASGSQLLPGSSQWTQVVFPISSLIRVGNDQTKSLQTLVKIQYLWNASGALNVANDLPFVFGGFQPDVGDVGAPLLYRVRPRSRTTGVVGNPSPATRYGVNPRRGEVTVYLPSATYDSQIDTWDVFRYGGAVTQWRFIGSTPSTSLTFTDNFDDAAAQAGNALDFDNFEPWPSVDLPNLGTASIVNGTVAVISTTNVNVLSYLPGTLVQLGGLNVYTLWARPTFLSGTNYLLQFVENAGAGTNIPYIIQEPFLADQHLPYMWGPDANGTVFACGDELRPGTLSFSKNYAPDSAPDSYNLEIVQPAEPLIGGEILDGLSFVASPERWWALYPQPGNPKQRYAVVQQPFSRGLAAPYAHCNDGQSIFWCAKDGIYSSAQGSLTDADLLNLFPHEGIDGEDYTYNGQTVPAPDYERAFLFRLFTSLGYLYFIYLDSDGAYRMLTLDIDRMSWSYDAYPSGITAGCGVEQLPQTGSHAETLFASYAATSGPNFETFACQQTANSNDFTSTPISCILATNEFNGGEDRAPKQWGDFFVDSLPSAIAGVTVTPMSLGAGVAPPTTIPASASRQRQPVSVGGIVVSDFLGLYATWTDDFSVQSTPTKLYIWQPSFTIQPARAVAWYTFGSAFGISGYMHVRELMLAWVSTADITLTITAYDGQSPTFVTIPSSAGAYQKRLFVLSANKGVLYKFSATSLEKFQLFLDDSEIRVGAWGRTSPYMVSRNFGGGSNREAAI